MSGNPWDAIARYYDLEHDDFRDDLPLYLGIAKAVGDPILEAACGSGRLLQELARAGFQVTGLDSSPGMLELARARLDQLSGFAGRVELIEGDIRNAAMPGPFGLAIVALDSFGLLVDQSDQRQALDNLRRHLRPGGKLVVDIGNGNARGCEPTEQVHHHYSRPIPGTERTLTKWVLRSTDQGEQVDHLTYLYDEVGEDGIVRRLTAEHSLRYFHRFELTLLAELCGYLVDDLFGDYDGAPFGADSPRLILVARRPDDHSSK